MKAKRKNVLRIVGIVLGALLVIGLVVGFIFSDITVDDIVSFTPENPFLAALVLIGIWCAKMVLMFIPILALFIAAGVLFPPGWGILVTYIGMFIEMTMAYYIGKRMGTGGVKKLTDKYPKAGSFFAIVERNDKMACFLTRLLPMPFPLEVTGMFYGASGVSYPVYIVFSLLGLTPTTVSFVVAGKSINNPLSAEFLVPFGIGLAISVGVFIVSRVMDKRREKAQAQAGDDSEG